MRKQAYPIPKLVGGLVKNIDPVFLEDNQSPNTHWTRWEKGRMEKEYGLRSMGVVDERPMLFDNFYLVDGTSYTICLTTERAYTYDETTGLWTEIVGSDVFTGDEDNTFCATAFFDSGGSDLFIVCNGKDNVQKWTGAAWGTLGGLVALGVTTARQVLPFYNHLVLGFTVEGGSNCPQRVRWSATGDPESWDSTVDPTAGFIDLTDTVDWITGLVLLGDRLFVFKERSIWEVLYTGGDDIFEFRMVIDGVGTYCASSIVSLGDEIIFFGTDDIYLFDGTTLKSVGGAIFPLLYETGYKIVNDNVIQRSPAIYMEETADYTLILPTSTDEPDWQVKYNVTDENWSQRYLDNGVSALGYYSAASEITWASAEGVWIDTEWDIAWKEKTLPPGAPTTLYGFAGGTIMEDNRATFGIGRFWEDEERSFDSIEEAWSEIYEDHYLIYETKDFVFAHATRFLEFRLLVKGDPFQVSYSIDDGETWLDERTITPSATEYDEKVYYMNETVRKIRFRIRTLENELSIKWIEPWYIPRVRSKEVS